MARTAFAANGAAILAILICWRLLDGTMFFLVQGWYEWLLYIIAAALAVLAAVAAWPAVLRSQRAHVRVIPGAAVGGLIVSTPLLLLATMPIEPLGSQSIARVSGEQDFVANLSQTTSDPSSRNLFEWAVAFQTDPPSELSGQPVDVVAFVYHPEGTAPGRFMAARFVVACCIADARGVTLPVEWPGASGLASDAWVRVTGNVAISAGGEPFVLASSVDPVEPPTNPYLYP
jgi:uncharacterized repeat protein (TIGR03943 family)